MWFTISLGEFVDVDVSLTIMYRRGAMHGWRAKLWPSSVGLIPQFPTSLQSWYWHVSWEKSSHWIRQGWQKVKTHPLFWQAEYFSRKSGGQPWQSQHVIPRLDSKDRVDKLCNPHSSIQLKNPSGCALSVCEQRTTYDWLQTRSRTATRIL